MRYPSAEIMEQWLHDWQFRKADSAPFISSYDYVARKCCDWQREQDALICFNRAEHNREQGLTLFEDESRACGAAIRGGSND